MNTFKIAVPTDGPEGLQGKRSGHFGHCKQFTLVDIENGVVKAVTALINNPHDAGSCMKPVKILKAQDVDSIIVGGMGANPFKRFEEAGISVFFADLKQCPDVQSAIDCYLNDSLPMMNVQQLCKGSGNCHQHHGEQ